MEIIQTIALLCQLNGAGADSASLIDYTQKKQMECQKYYIKCLDGGFLGDYKNLAKCISQKK
jgi:hypothetical protein